MYEKLRKYIEITEAKAKELYCKGEDIYICNNERNYWKMPASYMYASHAPAEQLFYRSIPQYEGITRFFVSV